MTRFTTSDPFVRKIARTCFPEYKGKSFDVVVIDPQKKMQVKSYWSGGSRDYYAVYDFARKRCLDIGEFAPQITKPEEFGGEIGLVQLPYNFALVEYTIFRGKELGIKVYVRSDNIDPKLLPMKDEDLTREEKIVLLSFGVKSTYAGQRDYRLHHANYYTGITRQEYEDARESLQTKGLVDKRNALTVDGRNAKRSLGEIHHQTFSGLRIREKRGIEQSESQRTALGKKKESLQEQLPLIRQAFDRKRRVGYLYMWALGYTQSDIARVAGVSLTTVSNALRNSAPLDFKSHEFLYLNLSEGKFKKLFDRFGYDVFTAKNWYKLQKK